MTLTTEYAPPTGAQIAAGLREVAAMFESADTLMPELLARQIPDQAPEVTFYVDEPRHVRMIAARLGVPVKEYVDYDGTHVSIEYGAGPQRDGEGCGMPTYSHSLAVRIAAYEVEK